MKEVIIEKIAMGAKPDPFDFEIQEVEMVNGHTIILAKYNGCLTFGGNKLMLLEGLHIIVDVLDPHFLEGHPVVARFIPTEVGWKLARLCAEKLEDKL